MKRKWQFIFVILFNGLLSSAGETLSFEETLAAVTQKVEKSGLKVMHIIDHSKNAKDINLNLPRTTLLLVGNPQVGTQLMLQNQQLALELPLKILVTESKDFKVSVSYRSPIAAMEKQVSGDSLKILEKMEGKLKDITHF
ncbi:MAG: hypothetical protein B7Y39_05550 [Bdellovibrio sp. 28-41-41]|nr:MAG: hypothetical protein B7Y39_05550 [Bdellovibrio sp. 28-41-41]